MTTVTPQPVRRRPATIALSVVLALHGVAHFAGVVESFDSADNAGSVEYLGGAWLIADSWALRLIGLAWAIAGILIVFSGIAVMLRYRYARETVMVAAVVSLALSIVGLWAAIVGVVVNLALLAVVTFAPHRAGS